MCCKAVGTCKVARTNTAIDVIGQAAQGRSLSRGLTGFGLQTGNLPCGLAHFTRQSQAGHLFGRQGLCGRAIDRAGTGSALAGQPKWHGDADFGLSLACIALEAVTAVTQLQRW